MTEEPTATPDGGNGLFGRRHFIKGGLATTAGLLTAQAAHPLQRDPWMRAPGAPMSEAGAPSPY